MTEPAKPHPPSADIPCHRCGAPSVMAVGYPSGWEGICESCDDADAEAILACDGD